jgi:hypothetical protein
MRSDKLLRSCRAAVSRAATLIWIKLDLINTVFLELRPFRAGHGIAGHALRCPQRPDRQAKYPPIWSATDALQTRSKPAHIWEI